MVDESIISKWRNIPGYSRYEVCQQGYVRDSATGKLLETITLPYGQKAVRMQADDLTWHDELVHKLVANEFVDNEEGYSIVKHRDDNPSNNHADNLVWSEDLDAYESMPFKKSELASSVYCYETDTIYDTAVDAAYVFGCSPYDIVRLCHSDDEKYDTFYHFCFVKDIHD